LCAEKSDLSTKLKVAEEVHQQTKAEKDKLAAEAASHKVCCLFVARFSI